MRLVEVVDEAPRTEDLGRFGLDQPRVVLRARLAPAAQDASGREPRLEVGKDSPVRPAVYARLDGHPRVVLVTTGASASGAAGLTTRAI